MPRPTAPKPKESSARCWLLTPTIRLCGTGLKPPSPRSRATPTRFGSSDQQLQLAPDNVTALVNQGNLFTLMGDFSNAIPPLTRALSLTNDYSAQVSRAFVLLRAGQLDAAEADYQELLRLFPAAYNAYPFLGDIALQKGNTNAAVRYYQQLPFQGHERCRRVEVGGRAAEVPGPSAALTLGSVRSKLNHCLCQRRKP